MRALLIGGSGFVSTVLARRLWADGHDVTVVARGLREDRLVPRDVERLVADRCLPGSLDKVIAGRSFDVVYDFFAHEGNAARQVFALLPDKKRMGRYVLVSSGAVYAVPVKNPIREDHLVGPRDGYGRGKLDTERAAQECARLQGIPLTIVRPNETLGPRDATGRRFLHLVQRAARGRTIVVPGKLETRLSWGYVDDLARLLALAWLRGRDEPVSIYNASGAEVFPFEAYLASIFAALGRSVPVRVVGLSGDEFPRWEGLNRLEWHLNCFDDSIVDSTRAREELGWTPRTGIVEAVYRMVRWIERERPDLLGEDPPDAERARDLEEKGTLVAVGPAALDPALSAAERLPLDDPDAVAPECGDRLGVPLLRAPAGPCDALADRLSPADIAVLLPLSREPDALDRAALLSESTKLGIKLTEIDHSLDRALELELVRPLERDGMPAFRITARGYAALLAAIARPLPDIAQAPPAELLLRFHALARTTYLSWIAEERPPGEAIDPFELGIPFQLPDRTGAAALPEGLLDLFGTFDDFARYFHDAMDGKAALARWRGALRLARARSEEERQALLRESAQLDRDARTLLADEGTRSELIHEIQVASAPTEPVEVAWVKRAEVLRRTLVEPRIAMLDALLSGLSALEEQLGRCAGSSNVRAAEPDRPPREGDLAPDFVAPGTTRPIVRLSEHRGKWIVLYFYPVDDTPGCTLEACRFRDNHGRLAEAGAVVLGVSTNDVSEHRRFRSKYGMPFELVSDTDAKISRRYGVYDERHRWAERVTFLIDPAGRVARVFRVQGIEDHPAEVLAALRK